MLDKKEEAWETQQYTPGKGGFQSNKEPSTKESQQFIHRINQASAIAKCSNSQKQLLLPKLTTSQENYAKDGKAQNSSVHK